MAGLPETLRRPLAVRPDRWSPYLACVRRGQRAMRGCRAVICGLARDVADGLPATIEALTGIDMIAAINELTGLKPAESEDQPSKDGEEEQ